jgi:hypothetical protein
MADQGKLVLVVKSGEQALATTHKVICSALKSGKTGSQPMHASGSHCESQLAHADAVTLSSLSG